MTMASAIRSKPTLPDVPYPGLRPFEKHEWPLFFGRERVTQEVINLLLERGLVVVHGPSGCGKSSLLRDPRRCQCCRSVNNNGVMSFWRAQSGEVSDSP